MTPFELTPHATTLAAAGPDLQPTQFARASGAPFALTSFAKARADHSAVLLGALLDDVLAALESGDDPHAAAEAYRNYIDDPDLLAAGVADTLGKAWDHSKHPRDDRGRFVSRDQLHAARTDRAVAQRLRNRVTDPGERAKLERVIGGEVEPPRTARGQARYDAGRRRQERADTRSRADALLRTIERGGGAGRHAPADLHALVDHLPHMTVADLRRARRALKASFGGDTRKAQMIDRLRAHVASATGAAGVGAGPDARTADPVRSATEPPPPPAPAPPAARSEAKQWFDAPLDAPPLRPAGVAVLSWNGRPPEARSINEANALFGKDVMSEQAPVIAAANALEGARCTITTSPGKVLFQSHGHGYHATRTIDRRPDGKLACHNDIFEIDKDRPGPDGKPINPNLPKGADILANQVRGLRALGVSYIDTVAAGNRMTAAEGGFVGYKIWPKLGYDGPIKDHHYDALPPELKAQMGASRSILDLYRTQAGQDWWAENGSSLNLKFDLTDGSRSMRTLDAYRRGRTTRAGS